MGSDPPSGDSTPRFTSQSATVEDLLKNQTVGLVALSDFRKRRADALEAKEKEAQDKVYGRFRPSKSGTATPDTIDCDGALTPTTEAATPPKKKLKKTKKLLSFHGDEDDDNDPTSATQRPQALEGLASLTSKQESIQRKLTPNPNTSLPTPKVVTKASLHAEAVVREKLRKEFLAIQEALKATEIVIPFVFYDGTNIPGGTVKVRKGDHVWLFLERCRKVGAELGVSGGASGTGNGLSSSKNDNRKAWARVGVDDLMCVRGSVIIPHHYVFYYFIANKIQDPSRPNTLLFDYESTAEIKNSDDEQVLLPPTGEKRLEGEDHDPAMTKVVDRRWYEKNKHIYPATLWKEYEVGKDFEEKMSKMRRDGEGNAFFYS